MGILDTSTSMLIVLHANMQLLIRKTRLVTFSSILTILDAYRSWTMSPPKNINVIDHIWQYLILS